jgi:glycerophosphoryl diester phosphodiesterase
VWRVSSAAVPPLELPDRAVTGVVAHRGSSGTYPEHTLAAYEQAIAEGADALECDVRLTSDGHLVCVHDRRVDRTSDGRGVVSTLALAELHGLDFGSWMTGAAPSPVLTLEALLDLVADCGRPVQLAIETKHPNRYRGRVEERLIETLQRYGLAKPPADGEEARVRVMSFSRWALARVHRLAPGLPTVYLMDRKQLPPAHLLPLKSGGLPPGTRIAGPGIDLVRAHPGYVARLHRAGHRVHVWTVDDPGDVELCLRLGVDTIITNHPARVLRQLGR